MYPLKVCRVSFRTHRSESTLNLYKISLISTKCSASFLANLWSTHNWQKFIILFSSLSYHRSTALVHIVEAKIIFHQSTKYLLFSWTIRRQGKLEISFNLSSPPGRENWQLHTNGNFTQDRNKNSTKLSYASEKLLSLSAHHAARKGNFNFN